jgi:hypothetical protein
VDVERLKTIRLVGDKLPRNMSRPLKIPLRKPIRGARIVLNTPWKEVQLMDIGNLEIQGTGAADQMKSIRKVKLQRQVLEDPSLARQLVKVESTGTYNARGNVIQAVSGDLGDA